MKHYKELLLKKLSDTGWELVQQDTDTEWWLEETWKIKSLQDSWGKELNILFLVDPQYDGTNKSQAVWAVMASSKIPKDRPINDEGVTQMDLVKGKFDSKLNEFVDNINAYRSKNGL